MNVEKKLGNIWGKSTLGRRSTKYKGPEVETNCYTFKEQKDVGAIGVECNVREVGSVVT